MCRLIIDADSTASSQVGKSTPSVEVTDSRLQIISCNVSVFHKLFFTTRRYNVIKSTDRERAGSTLRPKGTLG